MKRLAPFGLSLLAVFAFSGMAMALERDDLWKKVDEAIAKGLPRSAITNLNLIIPDAAQDQAWGEAAKAIARKIVLEGMIEGNKPEEKITRMADEIAVAPASVKPLLVTIQANWYWHYFQQNRWRFMQRTRTGEPPGSDFTTWDLPRLFAEIDKHFREALSSADQLKQTPVTEFDALLEKGTVPDLYRPTLYDFVAQEAIKFYTAGEQAGAKPEDTYELTAGSGIFGSAQQFMAWDLPEGDSPVLRALGLYQELLRFHQEDENRAAFLDVDLARLVYGYQTAFGEEKNVRFKAALKRFVERWTDHEVSALALYHWARAVRDEGDWVQARDLALRGRNAHGDSIGGKLCHNLVAEIESKSASITTERIWNCGRRLEPAATTNACPEIRLRYRNVTKVYFRAVQWAWEDFLQKQHRRPENLNDRELKDLLSRRPALEWSADLPPTGDFKEHTLNLPAPTRLDPGHYFLVASHTANFGPEDNQVSYSPFWVSDLALVLRPRDGRIEGFVLNANSGLPLRGAEVMAWYLDRSSTRVAEPAMRTDANGFFSFRPSQPRGYLIRARHRGREVATANEQGWNRHEPRDAREQTIFFTDRALYRPGQTISYKGILVRVDAQGDKYELLKGRRVTAVFMDPNGKEIAQAEHVCNDYGSFSGSFTAPRDRVMGRYQIGAVNGQAWFNIEEYKRPKFHVKLGEPETAPRLNDSVTVPGKAEAYTGAAIDDAQVKWRVVREVRWPEWRGWGRGWQPPVSGSQEIAHGTSRTGADGAFQIGFNAKPDPKVKEDDEASFTFAVYADVTDSAGETRSAELRIQVGFIALRAVLKADEWQTETNPVAIEVRTTTLDSEPRTAQGTVKVHRLHQPDRVHRALLGDHGVFYRGSEVDPDEPDLSDPNNWELAEAVAEEAFNTDAEGKAKLKFKLDAGMYRAMLETKDRFGKKVTARLPIQVLDPEAPKLAIKVPQLIAAPEWTVEPEDEFMAVWGTGYNTGRAFIEIEHRHGLIQRFWTGDGRTQQQIKQTVTEAMRGGFTLHVTQIRENRAYLVSRRIEVPWSNKELDLTWEHFVSKLQPGQKETWTLQIRDPKSQGANSENSELAAAEVVAALYDESLDQFLKHDWIRRFGFFYRDYTTARPGFANSQEFLRHFIGQWHRDFVDAEFRYRDFPDDLMANVWGFGGGGIGGGGGRARHMLYQLRLGEVESLAVASTVAPAPGAPSETAALADFKELDQRVGGAAMPPAPDLTQVAARRNLNKTAFFFPQLTTSSDGVVRMTFTMPEALTTWRFLGFAHDRSLRSGFLSDEAITSKDIMVQPNPPRFLREGDVLEFSVKVSNQSAARQSGQVQLTFRDAASEQSMDQILGISRTVLAFDIPAKESRSFSWRITVPDQTPFLIYKAVASTGRLSDGEEGWLPVLSRRILITESLPLPIRVKEGQGSATKQFEFTKLLESGQSDTLVNQALVVQMVSNPAWYAILALPYLMEFPHECTEQIFNRLYANTLARYIANSDPKIRRVFDQWKNTPALDSPLEKNQDLKAVLIEETPWLRQAKKESEARRNVGVLFDANRLEYEIEKALNKLREAQLGDGSWSWFPGGYRNDYITLYIVTGFGRLRHLGVNDLDVQPAIRALQRLDQWMDERYHQIQKMAKPDDYVPSSADALFLYGRSFFLNDQPVNAQHQPAMDFYLKQARRHWLQVSSRQSQGHLALALKRWGGADNLAAARGIMDSIKEHSVSNEEMGMFWRDTERSWWWHRAPIETQALMIEAFDEIMADKDSVEECRVWLLKQKQTQDWKTTKATADAVYALLLRGTDILASDDLVQVQIGGIDVTPMRGDALEERTARRDPQPPTEPGTGFYEARFSGAEIKPRMGEITVTKMDEGVAWGGIHWQYLEDMAKVTPYEGTPLKLKKSLFTKVNTAQGPTLQPVRGELAVGDELVVRIELRVDRDMEYVHLKDQRGSGTEPVNVISRYEYQDGLAYYRTTRDTASHFFIDYLPKGVYIFEYSSRIQHRGQYQTGVAGIQCMYAPEFNSHSQTFPLLVK